MRTESEHRCWHADDLWRLAIEQGSDENTLPLLQGCATCLETVHRMRQEIDELIAATAQVESPPVEPHPDYRRVNEPSAWSRGVEKPETSRGDDLSSLPQLGRYHLLERIDQGGEATVYRGWDPATLRVVALKVRPQEIPCQDVAALAEVSIMSQLHHRQVAQVFDRGHEQGLNYIVMEWIDGQTLTQLSRIQHLTDKQVHAIMEQLTAVMAEIHRRGVVHLDLKPDNIMVLTTEAGFEVKLIDFGLAWEYGRRELPLQACWGTPGFQAPEQVDGRLTDWSPATDVFGLCAVLYFLLTGHPLAAFSETEPAASANGFLQDEELPGSTSLRHRLIEICQKGLQSNPDSRFRDGRELHAALCRPIEKRDARRGWKTTWSMALGLPFLLSSISLPPAVMDGRLMANPDAITEGLPFPQASLIVDLHARLPASNTSSLWLWSEHAGAVRWQGEPLESRHGVVHYRSGETGLELARSTGRVIGFLAIDSPAPDSLAPAIHRALCSLKDIRAELPPQCLIQISPKQIHAEGCLLTDDLQAELSRCQAELGRVSQCFQLQLAPIPHQIHSSRRRISLDLTTGL